jgi:hypothetical protein
MKISNIILKITNVVFPPNNVVNNIKSEKKKEVVCRRRIFRLTNFVIFLHCTLQVTCESGIKCFLFVQFSYSHLAT